MNTFQEFMYKRNYARFIEAENRREEWDESVNRYANYFWEHHLTKMTPEFIEAIQMMREKEVVGSMRALWTAGPALAKENICGYNCGYITMDKPESIADFMYLLMCGTGVGFSVETLYVEQLPIVAKRLTSKVDFTFEDSREGWRNGFEYVLKMLYVGVEPVCDYSEIRPKGARLKTFGGYASGPEPLKKLVDWTIGLFKRAYGRRLTPIEVYDMCCHIATLIEAGGTRRSASIALFSWHDSQMMNAKVGNFYDDNIHRCKANNSKVFPYLPPREYFNEYWQDNMVNGDGEPGIFNDHAINSQASLSGREDGEYGVNPCFEIILRPDQLCNLSEAIIRPYDPLKVIQKKVQAAVTLGLYQSLLTQFSPFISDEFKKNCEEERLLGVSLTGLRDHFVLKHKDKLAGSWLMILKRTAHEHAEELSKKMCVNSPTAITCVKPSGTVSKLMNTSSGLHPRYAPFYVQRIRSAVTDPLTRFLIEKGVPWNPETGEKVGPDLKTVVFHFPIKSPDNAVCVADATALEQLEYYKMIQTKWCDHNASCTIYVHKWEWNDVRDWVYENWGYVSGLSFFPVEGSNHPLAPYRGISESIYDTLISDFPVNIDFTKLEEFQDNTTGSHNFACFGGQCDV